MNGPEAERLAPGVDGAVFAEPWQAEAFALVVALADRGVFSWAEWAQALAAEVHDEDAAADGSDYYAHWLQALEKLVTAKGVASPAALREVAAAWQRAARATPHGEPIQLTNDPLCA